MINNKIEKKLLALPNIVGVGIGLKEVGGVQTQDQAIIVLVKKKLPLDQLPQEQRVQPSINGLKTDIIEVGEFQAQGVREFLEQLYGILVDVQRTSRIRPAVPGVSIGHYRVSAGTFGAVVYDNRTGEPFILSNNHVLANSSNGRDGRARMGDSIYQPGPADGGTSPNNVLAQLVRYSTLDESRENEVDCALARPIRKEDIAPEILEIGSVSGITEPVVGMTVKKSGRTTGLTEGQIRAINVTTQVNYGQGRILRFKNQIFTTRMSEGGDSGSLVVNEKNQAVGLLFAGSDQGTLLNPIAKVLQVLKVQF